jgi:hypothetical protein
MHISLEVVSKCFLSRSLGHVGVRGCGDRGVGVLFSYVHCLISFSGKCCALEARRVMSVDGTQWRTSHGV